MNLTADSLKIDTDEGRFVLVVDTEEIGRMTIDIHALALEFESEVRRELRPYALEAEHARTAVAAGVTLDEYSRDSLAFDEGAECEHAAEELGEGYAMDDPKHPTYHERMVGEC